MKNTDEMREKIVNAAREVFSKYGYKKSTVDEVAVIIGKGKSTIYYYFPSKEDLFKEVIEREVIIFKNELIKSYSGQKSALEKLRTYTMVRMTKLFELSNFYEAIKSDYLSHLDFISSVRSKYDSDENIMIETILHEGVASGEFEIEEPHLAAYTIVIAMKGLEEPLIMVKNQTAAQIQRKIENLLKILFYGLVKR